MNNNPRGKFQKIGMMAIDMVILHFGVILAYHLLGLPVSGAYVIAAPGIIFAFLFLFYLFDVYKTWKRRNFSRLLLTISLALGLCYLMLAVCELLLNGNVIAPKVMIIACMIHFGALAASRLVYWLIVRKAHGTKRLLIVCESKAVAMALAGKLADHDPGWFHIAGYRMDLSASDLKEVDAVLVSPSLTMQQTKEIGEICHEHGKELLIVPALFDIMMLGAASEQIDDMLILSVVPAKMKKTQQAVKRLFDFGAALVMFAVALPIMAVLFVAIPLTSKGPAFYMQERIGQHRKVYRIYKFRSMVQDAESVTGPVFALEADPRITKIGRVIRATRLDELPQLWNVLKGDMSLVGPRPERPFFTEQFEQENAAYANRLSVKPGLTGLAQVMANYTTTVEDKLRYDLFYIEHYSFLLDIKILFQTIRVVLQREQASGLKVEPIDSERQLQEFISIKKAAD